MQGPPDISLMEYESLEGAGHITVNLIAHWIDDLHVEWPDCFMGKEPPHTRGVNLFNTGGYEDI